MTKPMQEPTFLVLTALLRAPLHGYALLEEVKAVSAGRVSLRVGTLYAALERLNSEGLVEVESEAIVNGRVRRTYRVTPAGARAVAVEVDRMSTLADRARARLPGRLRARTAGLATGCAQ